MSSTSARAGALIVAGGTALFGAGTGPALAQLTNPPPRTVVAPTNAAATGATIASTTVPPVREPGMVRVVAQCPAPATLPRDLKPGTPEFDAVVSAQTRLERTTMQVRQYATTQSATFGELRFGGTNNATVVVSFTGDLQTHADALTKIVDIPNGVVVCPASQNATDRVNLANEIFASTRGAITGGSITFADGARAVVVLRADRRDVADDLVRTFGTRIQVVLGEFSYPDPTVPREDHSALPPCGVVPTPSASSNALRWSVTKPLRVHAGGDITTAVSWKNIGRRSVTYESGDPITGLVTRVGGNRVVARFSGAIAGVGHGGTLRPGRTDSVLGHVSTASCDASLGYALPPGRYSVRFLFGGFDYSANGGLKVDQYVSNSIALTITNDAPPPFIRPTNVPLTPITLPGAGGGGPGATLPAVTTTP